MAPSALHRAPPRRGIQRRRLSDEVAETLREMILVGELMPDRGITQDELANELGVSTMPVREALLRLVAEGFVQASPNRAFKVIRSTPDDLRDVYWMHAALSAELTRKACLHVDEERLVVIRRHCADYTRAVGAGDVAVMERANWSFHRAINLAANAPRIRLALAGTLRFIPRGFYGLLPTWGPESVHGHERILAALEQRDPTAAAAASDDHVCGAGEAIARFFTDSGYWTRPTASPDIAPPTGRPSGSSEGS